ncbi:4-hydroxy-3-methylbut-2-enyl diphosphate reductase [Candidatus Deianiraea vastatrix]|uniref:4-hydroxy-3-methylbut-2-enyl diphosphate reductase n=1 Tax=Candidatus Deianiraea vastatrix TaxID=2163644 RepID=A0A5B8XDJ1_9RICK|nr:4-hydroxy-3-methylbut-2-enyl diphosphate reductase [Candidatus Deianiraea vastatrix]QED23333.1 4-hydroxy-3-methylbut-2-enyl diphosphate reductase [Candidatus Deianiraea vastatrix]
MNVFLISPRGFCAGVKRAVGIVEGAIEKYKTNIFVKHEIVHNEYVVNYFTKKGVKFVKSINEIPENSVVIFSAHGVSKDVEEQAKQKNLTIIDATCPLVKKVHRVAMKHEESGKTIILIGHKGHPEVIGTIGRVDSKVFIVENENDVDNLDFYSDNLAYITQTTLSVDQTINIIAKLKAKFPNIIAQDESDICYATQNRQDALKKIIHSADILLVLGSQKSSNSRRLQDLGTCAKIPSYLINSHEEIDPNWLKDKKNVAVTSGASSPEILIQNLIKYLVDNYNASIKEVNGTMENIEFHIPKEVRIKESDLF